MQFQDEREILCQMEKKYFVKYLEILTLSQHLEERGLNISNTLCVNWHIFPNPAPEGRTDTLQLSYIPQMLAEYIQYKYIYLVYTYS